MKRPIKDIDQEIAAFQNLLDVSGANLREAKKIVSQAKAHRGIYLMPMLGQKKKN